MGKRWVVILSRLGYDDGRYHPPVLLRDYDDARLYQLQLDFSPACANC